MNDYILCGRLLKCEWIGIRTYWAYIFLLTKPILMLILTLTNLILRSLLWRYIRTIFHTNSYLLISYLILTLLSVDCSLNKSNLAFHILCIEDDLPDMLQWPNGADCLHFILIWKLSYIYFGARCANTFLARRASRRADIVLSRDDLCIVLET